MLINQCFLSIVCVYHDYLKSRFSAVMFVFYAVHFGNRSDLLLLIDSLSTIKEAFVVPYYYCRSPEW